MLSRAAGGAEAVPPTGSGHAESSRLPRVRLFSSDRERRLWLLALVWLAAVYISLGYVRAPTEFLRERNLLRVSVAVLFIVVATWILRAILRRRPGRRELAALAVSALAYLAAFLLTERAEERVHFLQYGLFGGLVYGALLERRARREEAGPAAAGFGRLWPAPLAIVLTGIAGWGDEAIQAVLPDRIYDLRDVALNVAAGVLTVAAMFLLATARRRDRA